MSHGSAGRSARSLTNTRALVAGLVTYGVAHVVLCPGSRSAPLAYALAEAQARGELEVHVRVDERGAAFTALGFARFAPAVVVTTSGTAAANLHPALLEARHSGLGLIAITADRPHEMRGVGANQTTHQVGMYGPEIASVEIPAEADSATIPNVVSRIVARASGAFGLPAPSHLNIAFREPLVPTGAGSAPIPRFPALHLGQRNRVEETVEIGPTAVVVAGDRAGAAAAKFADGVGLPLLAEPSSGARGGLTAIGPYQRILTTELGERIEQVIVFGRPTLSRPVSRLLASAAEVTVVAESAEWVDVTGNATQIVGAVRGSGRGAEEWLLQWRAAEAEVKQRLDHDGGLGAAAGLGAAVVAESLAAGQPQVFLGSSMTIRYADIYAPAGRGFTREPVYAARGLAGIDGTISTATGIALASGPTRVILGDLAFAHDAGALGLGPKERAAEIQIVVLNDGGGGIFTHLEHGQEQFAATFERFFATPLQINLEEIANAYGYSYERIDDHGQITQTFAKPVSGRSLVEIVLPKLSGT